ncbi:MAG: endolytic transglycosylase MltG [Candidatus Eisenbacteria bacterium]|nr:endolytic transglycosylase MltG [Candidatus Eisenbacteria bacterium]
MTGARRPARPGPRPRFFRPRRWALLLLLLAGLAVAADLFLPAGLLPRHERRALLVERGQTLSEVAGELKRVGLLRGTLGFQVLARLMGLDRHIKAGQYEFPLGTTVPALLHAFARGMSGLNLVTLPEGLTLLEVGVLLGHHLGVPATAFDSLGHDRRFLDSLGIRAPSLEGYLAPDTYEFLPGTAPEVALRSMVARQEEVLRGAAAGRDSLPLGLPLHQLLTLASIVESEAQQPAERARIASVYLNRLQRGMRLQADPTVAYAMGLSPRSRLYLRQLRTSSPFNTYLYEGLPPGPICNPGAAAIGAVLNPAPDVRDLYFVARGDGGHFFSQTYEQHLANIRRAHEIAAAAAAAAAAGADSLNALDSLAVKDSVAAGREVGKAAAAAPGKGRESGRGR